MPAVAGPLAKGNSGWHDACEQDAVPIKHFRELRCWQLANQLRQEAIAICAKPPANRDRDFCETFRDAAGSICHNLADGFERELPGEIVRFFRYALASLAEVQDHFEECRARAALDQPNFDRLWDLSEHTKATAINFKKVHERKIEEQRRTRRRRKP